MKYRKLKDILLHIATTLTIVFSIVLWIFILTSDQRLSQVDSPSGSKVESRNRINKSLHNIYMPVSAYLYEKKQLYQIYDSKKNLSLEIASQLNQAKFNSIKLISKTKKQYSKFITDPDYLQFAYPDTITIATFVNNNSKYKDAFINRIFIAKKTHQLYIANDETTTMYKVKLTDVNFSKLCNYAKKAQSKQPVVLKKFNDVYSTIYLHPIKIDIYSYLTNNQKPSYFVSKLLGTSGITTRSHDGNMIYSSGYSKHLDVDSKTNKYQYVSYEKNTAKTSTDRVLDSIYYVNRLGLGQQDLRFFERTNSQYNYTNYIDGTPVFLANDDIQIHVQYDFDSIITTFNSTNLQIPIPFDGRTQTLPATSDIIANLKASNINTQDIQKIVVGYTLTKDQGHDDLVDLVPTYYIKAFDQWKTINQWQQSNVKLIASQFRKEQ